MKPQFVIHIQAQAPVKPALGAPCNGCGICCLSEPCPLGMLLSRRRRGACAVLRWDDVARQYRCLAVSEPQAAARVALPRGWPWLAPWVIAGLARWAYRWIAAGQGCDCSLEVQGPQAFESDRQSLP